MNENQSRPQTAQHKPVNENGQQTPGKILCVINNLRNAY